MPPPSSARGTQSPRPRGNKISKREQAALDIPSRDSSRTHGPITLPLDHEDVNKAKAAVRSYNNEYAKMLAKYGLVALIDVAYKGAMDAKHPFAKNKTFRKLANWRRYGLPLLASSPEILLECLLGEGVAPSVPIRSELKDLYDATGDETAEHSAWIQRYGQAFAPCQYVRELVSRDGESPTPNEIKKVVQLLLQYVSGEDEFAQQNAQIDCISRNVNTTEEDIEDGFHYFLEGMDHRARNILTFASALTQRVAELDEADHDIAMPWTLKYVGYARTAADRFKSYSEDRSQSWLTELMRNVFQFAFPQRGFKLDTHVIYFCTSLEECQIGEELLSRCGQAYFETGSGFGVTAAGLSVQSANTADLSHKKALGLWEMTMRFRLHNYDFFSRNMALEEERMDKYEEYLDHLRTTVVQSTQDIDDAENSKSELRDNNKKLQAELEQCYGETKTPEDLRESSEALEKLQTNLEHSLTCVNTHGTLSASVAAHEVHKQQQASIALQIDALVASGYDERSPSI
jgi:hypothetical protein